MAQPTRRIREQLRNFRLDSRMTGTSSDWAEKSAAHWRDVCRAHSLAGGRVKVAELGGGQDTPFEQAFANLAHAYLKDKAPKLLDYEVGFQLVEKNQENTKAVGVFGFKVADQWLYAPVFFLNGDLKGHELLYLRSQDLFVPMKDNWINYLLGRKPAMLGKAIGRQTADVGALPPDLGRLTRSPYKYASATGTPPQVASWFADYLPTFAATVTRPAGKLEKYAGVRTFLDALVELGRPGFEYLEKMAAEWPTVYRLVEERYGRDALVAAARAVGRAERGPSLTEKLAAGPARWASGDVPPRKFNAPTRENGGVGSYGRDAWDSLAGRSRSSADYDDYVKKSVLGRLKASSAGPTEGRRRKAEVILRTDLYNGNAADVVLTDGEKKTLVETGRVVRDDREGSAVSKVYAETTSFKLYNPDETNVYEVLVRPGGFEKCLIVMHPIGRDSNGNCCTLISLEGENRWVNIHPSRVFCRSRYSKTAWNEWFADLPDASELPTGQKYSYNREHVVLLGPGGQGTFPLAADESYEDGARGRSYSVSFRDHCDHTTSKPYLRIHDHTGWRDKSYLDVDQDAAAKVEYLRFTGRHGASMRVTVDELQVPTGVKKFTVSKPSEDSAADGDCCLEGSSRRPLTPGDLADVRLALLGSTVPLELLDDRTEVSVNGERLTKESAFRRLVADWGLRADTADVLLKEAADRPREARRYRVKLASPFLSDSGPTGPGFPEDQPTGDGYINAGVPTRMVDEKRLRVDTMVPDPGNREAHKPMGPDPETMRVAQTAAQTGQREVFDTAMLGGLLRAVRQDNLVDKYLGDLMKGLDRLGRIYFQFLWHGEEFEDRYGKQDLPELEDGLRNAFEANGDVILVLKRKSVEPFAEQGTSVDLGSIANQ